jgi:hypothetical protein
MFENAEYYVQLQAKRHELLMPDQKDDFKIDRSFLSGLSENDFHTAYTELFNLITNPDASVGVWSSLKVLQSGFNTLHTPQGAGY